jgi:hypothetical protein
MLISNTNMAEIGKHHDTAQRAPLAPSSCPQREIRADHFNSQYWRDLFEYTRPKDQELVESQLREPPVSDFQRLQMMNITHLLHQLAHLKATINHKHTTSAEDMSHLQRTLHHYGTPATTISSKINSPLTTTRPTLSETTKTSNASLECMTTS